MLNFRGVITVILVVPVTWFGVDASHAVLFSSPFWLLPCSWLKRKNRGCNWAWAFGSWRVPGGRTHLGEMEGELTPYTPKNGGLEDDFPFNSVISRFHVNFQGSSESRWLATQLPRGEVVFGAMINQYIWEWRCAIDPFQVVSQMYKPGSLPILFGGKFFFHHGKLREAPCLRSYLPPKEIRFE